MAENKGRRLRPAICRPAHVADTGLGQRRPFHLTHRAPKLQPGHRPHSALPGLWLGQAAMGPSAEQNRLRGGSASAKGFKYDKVSPIHSAPRKRSQTVVATSV